MGRPSSKRFTILKRKSRLGWPDSSKTVSGKPGVVQRIFYAAYTQLMQLLIPVTFLIVTYLSLYFAQKIKHPGFRWALHGVFILLSIMLMSHVVPGFNNIKLIDAIKFSEDSLPFTMYLNFDKPFVGLFILLALGFGTLSFDVTQILKTTLVSLLSCVILLISVSLSIGYIQYDFKIPDETWIWALNNLFLVCTAEELFFRRYVQEGLSEVFSKYKWGSIVSLISAALFFGLIHFKGGVGYVLLSTVAGLFYGYAYAKTGRVEAAILTHFGVNIIHFTFFTYPALSQTAI